MVKALEFGMIIKRLLWIEKVDMKRFTFDEYAKALKGAGPKMIESILYRAREYDNGITFAEYVRLEDLADIELQRWKQQQEGIYERV